MKDVRRMYIVVQWALFISVFFGDVSVGQCARTKGEKGDRHHVRALNKKGHKKKGKKMPRFVDTVDLCNKPTVADIKPEVGTVTEVECPVRISEKVTLANSVKCNAATSSGTAYIIEEGGGLDCDGNVIMGDDNSEGSSRIGISLEGDTATATNCSVTNFEKGATVIASETTIDDCRFYENFDGLEIFSEATDGLIQNSIFIGNLDSGIVSKALGAGGNKIKGCYIDTVLQECQGLVVTETFADVVIEDTIVIGSPGATGFAFRGRDAGSLVQLKNVVSCFQTNFNVETNVDITKFKGVTCDVPPDGFECASECPVCQPE